MSVYPALDAPQDLADGAPSGASGLGYDQSPSRPTRKLRQEVGRPPLTTCASPDAAPRAKYKFGRTLGAGTYGVVREADGPTGKVAVKIILKKNVKGNEKMVYDELEMLQRLKHPHIVQFVDWFESKVRRLAVPSPFLARTTTHQQQDKFYIVTQLATSGELFDRICDQGKFTEKDASQTIKQVLSAVNYLHNNNVVHRGAQAVPPLFPCLGVH